MKTPRTPYQDTARAIRAADAVKSVGYRRRGTFVQETNRRRNEETKWRRRIFVLKTPTRQGKPKQKHKLNRLGCDWHPLFFTAARLAVNSTNAVLIVLCIAGVLIRRQPRVPVPGHRRILTRQINALAPLGDIVPVALGESPRALRQTRLDNGLAAHPVAESVLAVLDDGLAGVVAVVGLAGFAGGDGGVVDEVEEVLAVAGDDGDLLAVLTEGVELVLEGGLDLFAGDVGKLGFGDEGLGLGADEFLFEDDDARGLRVLVLQLGDLVRDLLLACGMCLAGAW